MNKRLVLILSIIVTIVLTVTGLSYAYNDGGAWTDLDSNNIFYNNPMNGTIKYRSIDNVENISEEASINIKIERTAPTVEFTTNGNNTYSKT